MSDKTKLSTQRTGTVINSISKKEDNMCQSAVQNVISALKNELKVTLVWEKKIMLKAVISKLSKQFPSVSFSEVNESTHMSPDGGVTYLQDNDGHKYPILIAEVKNQGTNAQRALEGKKKQSLGNAVERLGKNVIGLRAFMLNEGIFPFACFGDGCDFAEGSCIRDRVVTIAMFGALNEDHTACEGPNGLFNRGSYYFREAYWTYSEMYSILYDIAKRSIYYYFSKYGEASFR